MKLYEIMCPVLTNDGYPTERGTKLFLRDVATIAGGYTKLPECEGFWRDPDSGKEYVEPMIPVRIACSARAMAQVVRAHQAAFPDQACVLWYAISDAVHFTNRPKVFKTSAHNA